MDAQLTIGLPKGSLNNPARRGYTARLLYGAGFDVKNYEPGSEGSEMPFDNFTRFRGVRVESQRAPQLLAEGQIDALFAGEDWIKEWELRGKPNEKIMDLGYGNVKVVVAVKTSDMHNMKGRDVYEYLFDEYGTVQGSSEYPNLAVHDIMESQAYRKRFGDTKPVMIDVTGKENGSGSNRNLVMKHVIGDAEMEAKRGANYIVECMQSGKSLEEAGLIVAHLIMESQAGLYASKIAMEDPVKNRLVRYLGWMLEDGVMREAPYLPDYRVFVDANVSQAELPTVEKGVVAGKFCEKGPNVIPVKGIEGFSSIRVEIPMAKWPELTYMFWEIKQGRGMDAVTGISITPILKSLR